MAANLIRVLGIDPGISGGAAIYTQYAAVPILPGALIELPTYVEGDHTNLVDGWKFRKWMREFKPNIAFVEQVFPMPSIAGEDGQRRSMGATSAFNFGRNYQTVRDAVTLGCDVPLYTVSSREWQRMWNLKGGGAEAKENSRQCAVRHFSAVADQLKRKKDHGKAESLLIAAYGALWVGGGETFEMRNWDA